MTVQQVEDGAAVEGADSEEIARKLGIPAQLLTSSVLTQIVDDPLYLHHLELCRNDPAMLGLLLGPEAGRTAPPEIRTTELLSRAGVAIGRWAASGFGRVPEDAYRARMTACQGCEHLAVPPKSRLYRLTGSAQQKSVCGLCGCDVRRKAWLPTEHCPDGRWSAEG
ncbi:hypothetical protein [Kitasatospora sp. NPDC057223]|uniref:hypothetical protein n=1 Tax=Kitasatospora sp. NPDC057223 TaxID=3346055 RepID=UPI0036350A0E